MGTSPRPLVDNEALLLLLVDRDLLSFLLADDLKHKQKALELLLLEVDRLIVVKGTKPGERFFWICSGCK